MASWCIPPKPEKQDMPAKSLADVMSEQMAAKLHADETLSEREQWACQACTFLNHGTSTFCAVCTTDRLPEAKSSSQPEPGASDSGGDDSKSYHLALKLQQEEQEKYNDFCATNQSGGGKVFLTPHFYPSSELQQGLMAPPRCEVEETRTCADTADAASPTRGRQPNWPRRDKSLKGQGGDAEIITKHDPDVATRRNLRDLEASVPAGMAGNLRSSLQSKGTRLSGAVTNRLKTRLKRQAQNTKGLSNTVEKDRMQTHAKGLDQRTRLTLFKLVNAQLLDEVNGAVRTGKEAIVYHAVGPALPPGEAATFAADAPGFGPGEARQRRSKEGCGVEAAAVDGEGTERLVTADAESTLTTLASRGDPVEQAEPAERAVPRAESQEYAIKVFKTTLTEFKNRLSYVEGDHRFNSVSGLSHQNPRKVVRVWAEKEFKNLTRMFRAGLPCPEPVRLADNVLVMTFLGRDGWAAPQLREAAPRMTRRALRAAYAEVATLMRALYVRCRLVHADLSEYNLLFWNKRVFVIDVGQAVEVNHPMAAEFLSRDAKHVTSFFLRRGVDKLPSAEALVALVSSHQREAEVEVEGEGEVEDKKELESLDLTSGGVEAADVKLLPHQQHVFDHVTELGPWASRQWALRLARLFSGNETRTARAGEAVDGNLSCQASA